MSDQFTETWIDSHEIKGSISKHTQEFMLEMLEFSASPKLEPTLITPTLPATSITYLSNPPASLSFLMDCILKELETNLHCLLTLNPSRREAIVHHLDRLSGILQTNFHSPSIHIDAKTRLQHWIEGPLTNTQSLALKAYSEEIATLTLGQILVLKGWSDRGIRRWTESDLGRVNWALSTTLKPHIPLDREGWQLTRPNLYSWFIPSLDLQKKIFLSLCEWKMHKEGSHFLFHLLNPFRKTIPENADPLGYDSRFFECLWGKITFLGFNPDPQEGLIKRNKIIFSPTLRNGSIIRVSPATVAWVGLESSAFQLMLAELMHIWWEPTSPPFWSIGTGLEVHPRDQLALSLDSQKPSVISRISEMEACDAAFVFEEQTIRLQGRNINSIRLREQLDSLPYFKRLKSPGTSLGDLQACVALSKLRPGGIFIWAREEALSSKDGSEVLAFLLNRAKFISEWDFSELEHSLPMTLPLYPKHLYLFKKENQIEERLSNRPIRYCIEGQLRSHIELSLMLEDAFLSTTQKITPRGHWTIFSHLSPTPQKDWIEKWPDPTSHHLVKQLDELRNASLPIAHFSTIRPTPDKESTQSGKWSVHLSLCGFWISFDQDAEGRKLIPKKLPKTGEETEGSGFMVLVPNESWIVPLCHFLKSHWINKWLDHHAERRGEKWIIHEQIIKWLPIPKVLLNFLGVPTHLNDTPSPPTETFISKEWKKWISEVPYQPKSVQKALNEITLKEKECSFLTICAALFVKTAETLDQIKYGQNKLFSLVTSDGRIKWRELLDILPREDCISLSIHSKIRFSGTIPPHLPIDRIDRVKAPTPGILLATESGFNLHISSENSALLHILWEQLEGLLHPTWNELLHHLRLPRHVEVAESTALEILRAYEEQKVKIKELEELIASCRLF